MPTERAPRPELLLVAHGTASAAGAATTSRLHAAVRAARPQTPVRLCFLDVVQPRLPQVLAELAGRPLVVVPLLLSTGYHVETDIPAAVAGYPAVRTARHLGPDPLLTDVLVDRLAGVPPGASTALVGAGSSRAAAADELGEAGRLLAQRLDRPVRVLTVGADLRAALQALSAPVQVATYLLAEGQFATAVRQAVAGLGAATAPLGVQPALVRLIWARYDAAAAG